MGGLGGIREIHEVREEYEIQELLLFCGPWPGQEKEVPGGRGHAAGLEKVPISPWLLTLLHICWVIPTPQSPETPRWYRRKLLASAENYARAPKTTRERRCCPAEHQYCRIEWRVFRDVSLCFKCFMMFHNVLRVFHDVLLVVHYVLRRFTMYYNVLQVFMMFNYV